MKRLAPLLLLAAACGTPPKPAAKTVAATPAPSAAVAPRAAPPAAPPPPTIPELTPEPFEVDGKRFRLVFAIEGATIVVRDNVVGYIDGAERDKVEWIAKIPKEAFMGGYSLGPTSIYDVKGRYPDSVDVFFETMGRGSIPELLPLTGKGTLLAGTPGGDPVMLSTRLGDSDLVAMYSKLDPYAIHTVRGPKLTRNFQTQDRCKPGEVGFMDRIGNADEAGSPQVVPYGFASTTSGRLFAFGERCKQEVSAEIWDPGKTTSRIVDLRPSWGMLPFWGELVRGAGADELWGRAGFFQDLLHYRDGTFGFGPHLDSPIRQVFASESGELHVVTNDGILYRLTAGET